MKEINIIEILELINKFLPDCYYSILEMDASMAGAKMSDGTPAFEQINNDIKNYSSGYTADFATSLIIAKQFNDVKDLYVVVNKYKQRTSGYEKNERKKYINNSLLEFVIDDMDLIELTCSDKYIEECIKARLGEFPIRVNGLP